jgi:hypothetical protein
VTCETAGDRRDADIGDHLDRKGRAEHGTRSVTSDLECKQPECNGHQTRADQGDGLRREGAGRYGWQGSPTFVYSNSRRGWPWMSRLP